MGQSVGQPDGTNCWVRWWDVVLGEGDKVLGKLMGG